MPRSRKRGRRAEPSRPDERGAPARTVAAPPRPSRSEQRNAAVRAQLEPLAPGERPGAVTVAAIVAAVLGVLNVALYAAGVRVEHTTFAGTVGVGAVLLVAAVGMWRARYWAVLGFEVVLAVTCVVAALSLFVASNVAGAVRASVVLAASGALFWKLIRAMARIQMPERPGGRNA
jgi:hypothetical protein